MELSYLRYIPTSNLPLAELEAPLVAFEEVMEHLFY